MDQVQRAVIAGLLLVMVVFMALPAAAADIVVFDTGSASVTWKPLVSFEHGVLTISTPDGLVLRSEFGPSGASFSPFSLPNYKPPDGTYLWEISLGRPSQVNPRLREMAKANRSGNGDPEVDMMFRAALTRATLVQSGAFQILNGAIVPVSLQEGARKVGSRSPGMSRDPFKRVDWPLDDPSVQLADQVIPDDLIVQGSECVGLDCVNNENFGFDTIRLKENNLRIHFDDTSTSAGFPANDWRLIANDSASGGSSKFSIEDSTSAKTPFTITAGASTNSIFVDSTGRVGLRTATPVLDLHVATSNTPAHRFEQNNTGGFTAQTWDIGANEANFFVRDVTSGSRLPLRIRPGAPTSSLDITADGNVGFGVTSAGSGGSGALFIEARGGSQSEGAIGVYANSTAANFITMYSGKSDDLVAAVNWASTTPLTFRTQTNAITGGTTTERMRISSTGNVGIGTTSPAVQLHTTGGVRFAGVANCAAGIQSNASGDLSCLPSSREFKNVTGDLEPRVALANVMALRPQVGSYKETPDTPEHWLIAEEAAAIDPALVGFAGGKPFTIKTHNVVADLIAVVQQQQRWIEEQQRFIEQQQRRLEALERAAGR